MVDRQDTNTCWRQSDVYYRHRKEKMMFHALVFINQPQRRGVKQEEGWTHEVMRRRNNE